MIPDQKRIGSSWPCPVARGYFQRAPGTRAGFVEAVEIEVRGREGVDGKVEAGSEFVVGHRVDEHSALGTSGLGVRDRSVEHGRER